MKLTDFAALNNNKVNGNTLRKPDLNLLAKLDAMNVEISDPLPRVVTNHGSGFSGPLHPLIAVLVEWVYETHSTYDETYSTYGWSGGMSYNGVKVSIGTFDRIRYLILALDKDAFSDFID